MLNIPIDPGYKGNAVLVARLSKTKLNFSQRLTMKDRTKATIIRMQGFMEREMKNWIPTTIRSKMWAMTVNMKVNMGVNMRVNMQRRQAHHTKRMKKFMAATKWAIIMHIMNMVNTIMLVCQTTEAC